MIVFGLKIIFAGPDLPEVAFLLVLLHFLKTCFVTGRTRSWLIFRDDESWKKRIVNFSDNDW